MGTIVDDFARRAGTLVRAAANDLKRDDEQAERDLGLAPGTFREYTEGRRAVGWDLIRRAAQVWPMNERDLLPVNDDCPEGVHIVRAAESEASSRVLRRAGRPYYEYRDTAMSRIGSYRPEWIRMLQVVGDDDADNPAVQWNRGHLLYQFTYFIGPVNYYCEWAGLRRCFRMQTGDSVWGLPFAPHSFAARSVDEPALILALTYGGDLVGDPQRELSVLGTTAARELMLDAYDQSVATAAALRSLVEAKLVTVAELVQRTGLARERVAALTSGAVQPKADELVTLADGLGVCVRDLLPPTTGTDGGVTVRFAAECASWPVPTDAPAYQVTRLADDPLHPHTSALEVEVVSKADDARAPAWLTTYQHQYAYVLGPGPVRLTWGVDVDTKAAVLGEGDSLYVEPRVPISFAADRTGARVLLLRIGGAVTTEVRSAMSAMAAGGIDRYVAEDRLWYSTEGN